jgi:hypothetical protein
MNKWKLVFYKKSSKKILYIFEDIEDKIICNVDENVLLGNDEYTVVRKVYDYLNKVIRLYLEGV